MVRFSLVPYSADRDQVHNLPKNRPIDSIDLNRLRKNKRYCWGFQDQNLSLSISPKRLHFSSLAKVSFSLHDN